MTSASGIRARRFLALGLLVGFIAPIALGVWETVLPAFGYFPPIGATKLSLDAWGTLVNLPGFWISVRLTIVVGVVSTLVSLVCAAALCVFAYGLLGEGLPERLLVWPLATPHAALAIGLAFVLAPSGWISRFVSSWLTGKDIPPDIATVNDPWGAALILGLLLKEIPFLAFIILAALNQVPVAAQMRVADSLGYTRQETWLKVILPQVYPQIRLGIYIVLAFSLSVVDVAIILGPGNPPTLSVAAMRWFTATDLRLLMPASAAAILQAAIIVLAIASWRLGERAVARIGTRWVVRGRRDGAARPCLLIAGTTTAVLAGIGGLALASMLLWSFAWEWRFPSLFPTRWSLQNWLVHAGAWRSALWTTLSIGLCSTLVSAVLAILWLESEIDDKSTMFINSAYLTLIFPQIGFLYGLNVVMLRAGLGGSWLTVTWVHVLFVLPYMIMTLRDSWRAFDPRFARAAAALGASPFRILLAVKLPVLLRPLLAAAAVGFSVSVAQYLSTLFIGAGRIATLTTEAVALSSGSDRRIVAILAVLQAVLPLLMFASALMLPRMIERRRERRFLAPQ